MLPITTPRLNLRDFILDDFEPFYSANLDPEYARFYSESELARPFWETLFERLLASAQEPQRKTYQLAICLLTGEFIGTVGFRTEDADNGQASYGCAIARPYWGAGYAYEASRWLIEFGFGQLPIQRLYAETNAENQRARTLAERLGMRLEGELRHTRFFKDRWWNTAIYAVLREEWQFQQNVIQKSGS